MKTKCIIGILIIIITATNLIIAQENYPKGILNIKWGDSRQKVKQEMLSQKGVTIQEDRKEEELFDFAGGKLSGRDVLICTFGFYKNKLFSIVVKFKIDKDELEESFRGLKKTLQDKYGKPAEEDDIEICWITKNNNNTYAIMLYGNYSENKGSGLNLVYLYENVYRAKKNDSTEKSKEWNKNEF